MNLNIKKFDNVSEFMIPFAHYYNSIPVEEKKTMREALLKNLGLNQRTGFYNMLRYKPIPANLHKAEIIVGVIKMVNPKADINTIFPPVENRIRKILNQKGMTQKQLAKATGLSEASIGFYVSGRIEPNLLHSMLIAKALNVKLNEVFSMSAQDEATDPDGFNLLEIAKKNQK